MHGFQGYPARLIPRHMELTWKEVRRAGEYKYNFSNKNLKRQRQSKNYVLFQKLIIVQMIFLGGETSLESYAKRPTYTQHSTGKVKYLYGYYCHHICYQTYYFSNTRQDFTTVIYLMIHCSEGYNIQSIGGTSEVDKAWDSNVRTAYIIGVRFVCNYKLNH